MDVYLTPHGARESHILGYEIQNWNAYAGQFNFGARTGGLHDEHVIDNFVAVVTAFSEQGRDEDPSVLDTLNTGLDFGIDVDFDDGLPTGARFYEAAEAVDGAIRLTPNVGSLQGGLSFPERNDGRPVAAWSAEFDFRMGGPSWKLATGADGLSITFSRSGDAGLDSNIEEGLESGVAIGFDTYRNRPGVARRFGIGDQPETVLIGTGGAILRRGLRGQPLTQALRAALRDQLRPE